ncbi:MAG: Ig-like domain-containing protein [Oscillospiraceae bacterium]|nr:Ig-like domain-containing protein [Oscillospiraceae bacterium]
MRFTKKALAVILVMVLIIGILPINALAASSGTTIDLSDASPRSPGTGWTYSGGTYTITGNVTVMMTGTAQVTNRRLVISGGTAASPRTVTLQDINMSYGSNSPIMLNTGAYATFVLNGTNTVTATGANYAGILTAGANLTISAGTGAARLTVQGGADGAGIGGGRGTNGNSGTPGGNGGNITINGGNISATSTYGAGIGGGRGGNGASGGYAKNGGDGATLTINGGTVTANSNYGAGIGGGRGGDGAQGSNGGYGGYGGSGGYGGTTTINGGEITASSRYGAGRGGGNGGNFDPYIDYQGSAGGDGGTTVITAGTFTASGAIACGGGKGGSSNRNYDFAYGRDGSVGYLNINLRPGFSYTYWTGNPNGITFPGGDPYAISNKTAYLRIRINSWPTWELIRNGKANNPANPIATEASGTPIYSAKEELYLPTSGTNGEVASWTSDNEMVICVNGLSGEVTRLEYPADDALVRLTAAVTQAGVNYNVPFKVSVPTMSWEDFADTTWYDNNTSGSTFEIKTAEELAGFAMLVNGRGKSSANSFTGKTVKLTSNIDLSPYPWVSIGSTTSTQFNGMFEGSGCLIKGLKFVNTGAKGLFGYIGANGTVINTGLTDTSIKRSGSGRTDELKGSGGIAVLSYGKIYNCFAAGEIAADNAGGIVGTNYGEVVNCYFNGSIVGAQVGGVIGTNGTGTNNAVANSISYFKPGGAQSAVGVLASGNKVDAGYFTGADGILAFEGTNNFNDSAKLVNVLNSYFLELKQKGYDPLGWSVTPGISGGYPMFDRTVDIDYIITNADPHKIIVKEVASMNSIIDARVSINGIDGTDLAVEYTDERGVIETRSYGANIIEASAEGYRTSGSIYVVAPMQTRCFFLEKDKGDGKPYISMAVDLNTYMDVRSGSLAYTERKGDMINLRVSGQWNGNTPKEYILYQSGGAFARSEDGKFNIAPGLCFKEGKEIWLKMVAQETESEPVLLNIIIHPPADIDKAVESVQKAPLFEVTPINNGVLDGKAAEVFPKNVKLPQSNMGVLTNMIQSLDGTITFYGYIGDFKEGPKFGYSVGGLSDAFELLRSSKDKLKSLYRNEYYKLRNEFTNFIYEKVDQGGDFVIKMLSDAMDKAGVPAGVRNGIINGFSLDYRAEYEKLKASWISIIKGKLADGAALTKEALIQIMTDAGIPSVVRDSIMKGLVTGLETEYEALRDRWVDMFKNAVDRGAYLTESALNQLMIDAGVPEVLRESIMKGLVEGMEAEYDKLRDKWTAEIIRMANEGAVLTEGALRRMMTDAGVPLVVQNGIMSGFVDVMQAEYKKLKDDWTAKIIEKVNQGAILTEDALRRMMTEAGVLPVVQNSIMDGLVDGIQAEYIKLKKDWEKIIIDKVNEGAILTKEALEQMMIDANVPPMLREMLMEGLISGLQREYNNLKNKWHGIVENGGILTEDTLRRMLAAAGVQPIDIDRVLSEFVAKTRTAYDTLKAEWTRVIYEKVDQVNVYARDFLVDMLNEIGVAPEIQVIILSKFDSLSGDGRDKLIAILDDLIEQVEGRLIEPLFELLEDIKLNEALRILLNKLNEAVTGFIDDLFKELDLNHISPLFDELNKMGFEISINAYIETLKNETIDIIEKIITKLDQECIMELFKVLKDNGFNISITAYINVLRDEVIKLIDQIITKMDGDYITKLFEILNENGFNISIKAYIDALRDEVIKLIGEIITKMDGDYIKKFFGFLNDKGFNISVKAYIDALHDKIIGIFDELVGSLDDKLIKPLFDELKKNGFDISVSGYIDALENWVGDILDEIMDELNDSLILPLFDALDEWLGLNGVLRFSFTGFVDKIKGEITGFFDDMFDILDSRFIMPLFGFLDQTLDWAFDELMSALRIQNLLEAERSWKEFKSDFQAAKMSVGYKGCLDVMREKYGITEKDFTMAADVIKGNIGGIGYFEVKFDIFGRQLSNVGEIIVNSYAEGQKSFLFTVGIVPITIGVGGGLGLGVAAKAELSIGGGGVKFDGETIIGINPYMFLSLGVGVRGVLYVGVRGDASLPIRVYASTSKGVESYGRIEASASIEIDALFCIKFTWTFGPWGKDLWGKPRMLALAAYGALDPAAVQEEGELDFEYISRDYLENTTLWDGDWASGVPLQSSVLPGSMPQFAKAGDKTIMLLNADDGVSKTGDHVKLMYSVLDNGVWSAPKPVVESSTSDFYAKTVSVGDDLYLIWQKSVVKAADLWNGGAEPEAGDVLDEMLYGSEICVAKWDQSSQSFIDYERITDNDVVEMNPLLVENGDSVTALWTEVRAGDPIGRSDDGNSYDGSFAVMSTTLRDGEWSKPETLFSTKDYIAELAGGYVDGELKVAYGIYGDEEKPDIWLFDGNTSIPISTANGGSDLKFLDGFFYWQEQGVIQFFDARYSEPGASRAITSIEAPISGMFKVLDQGGKQGIVWAEPTVVFPEVEADTDESPYTDGYAVRASILVDGEYSSPITLFTTDDNIANFDATLADDGVWKLAMNTFRADEINEYIPESDPAHSLVYTEITPKTDVALTYAYAYPSEMIDGVQPVSLVISNLGETNIKQLTLNLTGNAASNLPVNLRPGETVTLRQDVSLSKLPSTGQLTATVTCANDSDPGNNTYDKLRLGLVDVFVEASQYRFDNKTYVTVELYNYSTIPADTELIIREGDETGAVLDEQRVTVVNGENHIMFYKFGDDEMMANMIYIEAATSEPDYNQFNNSAIVPIYISHAEPPEDPDEDMEINWISATGISINGARDRSVSLEDESDTTLHATVYPSNASNQEFAWSSSNKYVAYVSDEGKIIPANPGETVILASTLDGGYRDSVTLTVFGQSSDIPVVDPFIPVTNIIGVSSSMKAGTPLTLAGTVNPPDATNKDIIWSIQNAGTTGATLMGNTLSATSAGTVIVKATIVNGSTATTDYTQPFNITVTASPITDFIPVTNIIVVSTSMTVGTPLTLSGTVDPPDATNKDITWSIQNAGSTGATLTGNTLNATSAGTFTVKATIVNGSTATTDYTQPFNITVTASPITDFIPVTNIIGVSSSMKAGTPLTLVGAVYPANATNKDIKWSIQNAGTTGATLTGNTLSATSAGTVTVKATIAKGSTASTDYTQDFNITVAANGNNDGGNDKGGNSGAITVTPTPTPTPEPEQQEWNPRIPASEWAVPEIQRAYKLGLIPESLLSDDTDFTAPITRVEFAGVAVKAFENLAETKAQAAETNPFTDTSDTDALKAFNVGIMVGYSADKFEPSIQLNREQCATALTRVFKRTMIPEWTFETDQRYPLSFTWPAPFADDAVISNWAKESVYFMAANSIILGVGNNRFAPRSTTTAEIAVGYAIATREQALAIAVRMVDKFGLPDVEANDY